MSTTNLPHRRPRDHIHNTFPNVLKVPGGAVPRGAPPGRKRRPTIASRTPTDTGLARVGGFALLGVGAMTIAAAALHPPHVFGVHSDILEVARAHRDAWIAAHLLFLVATILLIVTFLALASIVRETNPGLAAIALGSSLAGAIGQMGFLGMDLAIWQMAAPQADLEQMAALIERIEASAVIGVPLYGLASVLGLGVALLLYGLVRRGAISAPLAVALALGLGLGFGFSSEHIVSLAGVALAVPGIVTLGWQLARDPDNLVRRMRREERP